MSKKIIGTTMLLTPFVGLFIWGGELISYSAISLVFGGIALFVVWIAMGLKLMLP